MSKRPQTWEILLAFGFGVVALSGLLVIAVFERHPTPLLVTVVRVTLAVACAGVAAVVPGFVHISLSPTANTVLRAGGAMAVFATVFFFNPPGLIVADDPIVVDNPDADYSPVAVDWFRMIDAQNYRAAYESASECTRAGYTYELFERLYESAFVQLGHVTDRRLVGAVTATELPTGKRGNFRVLTYQTTFGQGDTRQEFLVLSAEGSQWVVKNHNIALQGVGG